MAVYGVTSSGWLSPRGRVLARAGIGILTWVVAPDLVDEAVGDGLAWEMRLRALPSRLGVYFVLGLCLFSSGGYGQVLRMLTSGLALGPVGWQVPASTALTRVRCRVGEKPLESLFRRLAGALSPGRAPWSHICGLLAVAWDGTTFDAEDSEPNTAAFGKPANGTGAGGFPQLRLVALVACGTRAMIGAAFGPARGKDTGERELAGQLLGSLRRGMLLLADRGFYSYQLWCAAAAAADLLWRARNSQHLPVVRELPDGSYLTRISDPAAVRRRTARNGSRRRRGSRLPPDTGPLPGITVRVIVFTLTVTISDGTARTERYRLLTTLLDSRRYPAAELAAGYARRWAIETGFRDLKTTLRGSGRRLRGQTPDLARQQLWAYLVIYQALHVLIARAAARDGLDPARISFTAAVDAARAGISDARDNMTAALDAAETQMLSCLVPQRDGRVCARAVKQPRSAWPARPARDGPITHHAARAITITPPGTPAPTSTDQHKQPAQQLTAPP